MIEIYGRFSKGLSIVDVTSEDEGWGTNNGNYDYFQGITGVKRRGAKNWKIGVTSFMDYP